MPKKRRAMLPWTPSSFLPNRVQVLPPSAEAVVLSYRHFYQDVAIENDAAVKEKAGRLYIYSGLKKSRWYDNKEIKDCVAWA